MKIVQVSENKLCEIAEGLEDMLYCINELKHGNYGEREDYDMTGEFGMAGDYGIRGGGYGNRMGHRDDAGYPVMTRYGERARRRNRFGQFI